MIGATRTLAGPAVPREAWQTGAGVGGAARVDALGPLGNVAVMQARRAVVDGALVHGRFKHKADTRVKSPLSGPVPPKLPPRHRAVRSADGAETPGPQASPRRHPLLPAGLVSPPRLLLLPAWTPWTVTRPGFRPVSRQVLSQPPSAPGPTPDCPFAYAWRRDVAAHTPFPSSQRRELRT